MSKLSRFIQQTVLTTSLLGALPAFAGANPSISWNYGTITATPHYPIVGEPAHLAVIVTNPGDAPASNVQVKISFNDWGVTFQGWQEIVTVTIPNIPAGGSAVAETDYAFLNRTHTCLEALVVGADENTNPDDDRGQINLEIINAGETFSWDVPVVNNGPNPVNLLLVGACRGQKDGAAPNGEGRLCKQEPKEVVLAPGEELLVPIEIDLHGFAVGQELEFELTAYDLGAGAGAFLPQNRNHVVLRIVRETARHLTKKARLAVGNVAGQVGDKGLKKRVEEAGARLDQALGNNLWSDDDHVNKNNVFAHVEVAANQLIGLLDTELSKTQKAVLDEAARNLSDAARILAKAVNGNAAAIALGDAARASGD